MEELHAAIIGVGHLGVYHAEKYNSLSNINITAIVDTDHKQASHIAKKFGAKAYTDYRDILDKVDLVSIVTPTKQHFGIAEDCLKSHIHTLLEKPITQTLSEAQALINLAETNGVVLQVGHLERFNPAMQSIQKELDDPYFIESHRLAPFNKRGTDVDVVLDLMIHDIDIILSMIKSPLINIQSVGVPVLTNEIDIANARLQFANGCVANVTASRVSNKQMRKLRIFQPNACITVDFGEHKAAVYRKHASEDTEASEMGIDIEEHSFQDTDNLLQEITAFVHSVRTGEAPVVSGQDGKQALEVALEITNAIKKSRSGDQDKKTLLQSINAVHGAPL